MHDAALSVALGVFQATALPEDVYAVAYLAACVQILYYENVISIQWIVCVVFEVLGFSR